MGQPSRRASMEVIEAGGLLLERLAKRHELDGLMEIVNRQEGHVGEAPEQRAFALLGFGLPIYREKGHSEYFPAKSRRSRRRGARAVRDSLATEGGEQAVIFATHAIPAFAIAFWQCQAQQGQVEDVGAYEDYHGTIRSLLQGHYPLRQEDKDALLYARREVDVFKTGRPVTDLGVPLTGYGLALKEGRDPHEDASLVESHSAYALHVFRVEAQNHALRVGLASEPYESLMNDLLSPWDFSRDAGIWRLTIDAHWTEVVGDYFEWVSPRTA